LAHREKLYSGFAQAHPKGFYVLPSIPGVDFDAASEKGALTPCWTRQPDFRFSRQIVITHAETSD
jgi:hypothetical protein